MKPKAELMKALRARRKKQGLCKVESWVLAANVDKLRKIAARLSRLKP